MTKDEPPFVPLSPKEAAAYIGRSVSTLREWRKSGEGPPWIRRGRLIEYRRDKLDEWLDRPWRYSEVQREMIRHITAQRMTSS